MQLRLLKERKNLRKQLNFQPIIETNQQLDDEKDADKKLLFDKIHSLVEEKKLFIEPKLNADYLANKFDISSSKLTNVIKLFSDKKFNDYINAHKIRSNLKQFRKDKYSKEVQLLQAELNQFERALQAVVLNQYRRKVFEKNKINIKPVMLLKSKTIGESKIKIQRDRYQKRTYY